MAKSRTPNKAPSGFSGFIQKNSDHVRLIMWVFGFLALVGLAFGGHALLNRWFDRYPIQQIQIVGELNNVDKGVLKAALTPYVSENFFTVELDKVRETAESLTWIDYADAKKEWPNTLVVELQERIPVANWGKKHFLSKKGEIFLAESVQPKANLPTFIGREEQAAVIAERYRMMQAILNDIDLSIVQLKMADRVSWQAQLNNGLVLVVDENNSLEKLKRLTTLFPLFSEQQKQQLLKIDLRYDNGLAIKWKKDDGDTDAA